MRREPHEHPGSNDEEMWAAYHTTPPWTVLHLLHVLKTTVVCRLFARRILEMSGDVGSALELGCGTASTLDRIQRQINGPCAGIDRSREAIAIARRRYPNLQVNVGDIFDLPYQPRSFDLVYSVGLFEHFTYVDQRRLLRIHSELARRAVVMMVPADGLVFNSISGFNRVVLGRRGTWADEQVFSSRILKEQFPEYSFEVRRDRRFVNMILWLAWKV